jgi:putative membrane protein
LGGCERILKTPLPLIYTIILRKLVLVYCLVLPFEIVEELHWWTGVLTAFVSLTLLSIEQIGSKIEEPFGHDPNDLPLDVICNTIKRNIEELIVLAPISTRSQI